MLANQTLIDDLGNQVALFPLDYLYITQGENGGFSHTGSLAIDFVGTTTRYPYYAPCDMTMVYRGSSGGSYIYQSDEKVRWVDGTLDYISVWVVHDDTLYSLGRKVKQGELLGRTGTTGYVTGDHVHIEVAQGVYGGMFQNSEGVWLLHNQVSMTRVFSVNDTNIVNGLGYNWSIYEGGVIPPTEPKKKKRLPLYMMIKYY